MTEHHQHRPSLTEVTILPDETMSVPAHLSQDCQVVLAQMGVSSHLEDFVKVRNSKHIMLMLTMNALYRELKQFYIYLSFLCLPSLFPLFTLSPSFYPIVCFFPLLPPPFSSLLYANHTTSTINPPSASFYQSINWTKTRRVQKKVNHTFMQIS